MPISPESAQLIISGASVIFAASLTIVTYLYYDETKNQTNELERTREADFQPILKPTIDSWQGVVIRFAFENTGKGAAHNVQADWRFLNNDYTEEWEIPLLSPGERHVFHLPFDEEEPVSRAEEIVDRLSDNEKLIFNATYEDPLGNEYSTEEEEIDILAIIDTHSPAKELSEEAALKQIANQLSNLNKNVSDLQHPFLMTDVREQIKSRSVSQVLQPLEEHEELTMQELKSLSGLSSSAERAVTQLSESGFVELENEDMDGLAAFDSETVVRLTM